MSGFHTLLIGEVGMGDIEFWAKLGLGSVKWLRKHKRPALQSAKNRLYSAYAAGVHTKAMHGIREIVSIHMSRGHAPTKNEMTKIMNNIRFSFAQAVELDEGAIHSTLKLLAPSSEKENSNVITIARSTESTGSRECDYRVCNHPVGGNSDFASIVGCNDGNVTWNKPFTVFIDNNLGLRKQYRCSRSNPEYISTMVFPLRKFVLSETEATKHEIIGFLTFDSGKEHAFGKLPQTFDYYGRTNGAVEFQKDTATETAVNTGGLFADALSIVYCMLPSGQASQTEMEND